MSSSRILCAAGLALWACGHSAAPAAPAPASITPSAAHTVADVPVVIKGTGFLLTGSRRLGYGRVDVDSTFQAWLGATPLRDVVWVDEQTLRAVVPAGLAGDALDLAVEGPTGGGILAGAFRASPLTPPSLAAAAAGPALVSTQQTFAVSMQVTNSGQAVALGVAPGTPTCTGTGALQLVSESAAQDVPGTQSATFTWTFRAVSGGGVDCVLPAAGADANTGSGVGASAAVHLLVQAPATLVVTSLTVSPLISRGQSFTVSMVVTNTGEAAAQNVAPSPNPPALAATGAASAGVPAALPAVSIAGGSTATFSFSYVENGTGTGSLSFTAGANGIDANSSAPLAAASAVASTSVQRPAALSVTAFTLRSALGSSTINRGQAFTASLTVMNTGDASATGVLASALTVTATGGAAATTPSSPSATNIAGGASATFFWSFVENGTAPGTLRLAASASGTDGNSGSAISTGSAQSDIATVQAPAALSASVSAPSLVLLLQTFTVSFTVTNGGGGTVNAVAPASLLLSGASTTVLSGPTPASATVAGSGSATFSWTCRANAIGTLSVTASASGTDVNDGSTRFASASTSSTAAEVSQIASDPFGDGTPYSYVFDFNGRLYLGPNKSGTGGVRMLPDGSSVENVTFTFNNDTGQADQNNYNGGASPYPSLGFAGCTKNTAQCGPDNEDGRGVYGSGVIAGTPWLIASGSISGGGLAHFYATTDNMTAPDFDYIGLKSVLNSGEVQGTSAMIVFHDRIYLGFPSAKANRPFMLVVNNTPPVPGYDASSADAVDLSSTRMPYIGANGSPKNSALTQMIDAFATFNDLLYLGNSGGWMRSTKNAPGSYQSSPSDWAVATPSAAAYTAKTSVTTNKLADLVPSDRALPQMAVLNGKLYAARNTTAGPQLWACVPGSNLACDPANWSLIAANSSGDASLSQFNDANNASISLLVATPSHLYVGFDDAADGVRLYRSTTTSPSTMADFQGQAGCSASAGSASCPGLGGNGFGAGVTRIFDGRALNYGGTDYLYLTAGTGTGGVRVLRLSE